MIYYISEKARLRQKIKAVLAPFIGLPVTDENIALMKAAWSEVGIDTDNLRKMIDCWSENDSGP